MENVWHFLLLYNFQGSHKRTRPQEYNKAAQRIELLPDALRYIPPLRDVQKKEEEMAFLIYTFCSSWTMDLVKLKTALINYSNNIQ